MLSILCGFCNVLYALYVPDVVYFVCVPIIGYGPRPYLYTRLVTFTARGGGDNDDDCDS